ncbi:MAG TPA: tRNA uridine-5-carboxymethylaminomethyl(34) synthesis GTPase MnmE [Pseudolabrys sp.]|nr:tRNA uridine-5-carboxymethylaminomethyl(34) synthesis GTPase MnmE [Pseudolabrys sp.]
MSASPATIFALSSGRPPAAIAVIRISGPRAGDALTALGVKIPPPRKAGLARIRDPQSGELIDEALVLWFPGPNSETGEDTAELQAHGGRAVIAAILAALAKIEGLRMAEPGEFTRRGFENGKLDLTAVEGLADLVGAETEAQRRQAFRQMKGALGNRAEDWRQRLIRALALVEARIDFSDEADVPEDLVAPALEIARELASEIEAALADGGRGERLRDGLVVAIAGPPNAGKSTLLNRIARREAAIVSPYAGTTRDVIEVHLDLDGWPVTLLDTAGIRETGDPIEMEGVRRARERAAAADLVLWVIDARVQRGQSGAGNTAAMESDFPCAGAPPSLWLVRNKADLLDESALKPKNESQIQHELQFITSAARGAGIEPLLKALSQKAELLLASSEAALVTRERHRKALQETLGALRRVLAPELGGREDLLAEELRAAAMALGRLTGRVDVEDVLDVIFRDFCIGK